MGHLLVDFVICILMWICLVLVCNLVLITYGWSSACTNKMCLWVTQDWDFKLCGISYISVVIWFLLQNCLMISVKKLSTSCMIFSCSCLVFSHLSSEYMLVMSSTVFILLVFPHSVFVFPVSVKNIHVMCKIACTIFCMVICYWGRCAVVFHFMSYHLCRFCTVMTSKLSKEISFSRNVTNNTSSSSIFSNSHRECYMTFNTRY